MTHFWMEAMGTPDPTLFNPGPRDALRGESTALVDTHRPRSTQEWSSGEWHRTSSFTDDVPFNREAFGPPSFEGTYADPEWGRVRSWDRARDPLRPVPDLVEIFPQFPASFDPRTRGWDVREDSSRGIQPGDPSPPPPAPSGLVLGGGFPSGRSLSGSGPLGRESLLPPLLSPVRQLGAWPSLCSEHPPCPFTPPLKSQEGGGDADDMEEEQGAHPYMGAAHSLFRNTLNWMRSGPPEASHATSGVLPADRHTAQSGIMMQPEVLNYAREIWENPHSHPAVDEGIDLWHHPVPGESLCLSSQPPVRPLFTGGRSSISPSKEVGLLNAFGEKVYANGSLHLRQANADAILAGANHRLWEWISRFSDLVPARLLKHFTDGVHDALHISELMMNSAMFQVDTASRAMCLGVVLRRQAWLESASLQPDLYARVLDLPFNGRELFSPKTEAFLKAKANSLTPISRTASLGADAPIPGGTLRGPFDNPGFRGFMRRRRARAQKGSESFRKHGRGGSLNAPWP